jgi:two-component system sensor histidine kinase and response regulator WspE
VSIEPEACDPFLLSLFRQEAISAADGLTRALEALEADGDTASALRDAIRFAHSVKGAARVVGLDLPSRVGGALESSLERYNGIEGRVDRRLIDAWRTATNLIRQFGSDDLDPAAPRPEIVAASERAIAALTWPEPVVSDVTRVPSSSLQPGAVDGQLVEMFRTEVEQCAAVLSSGLVAVESESDPAAWDGLLRSVHSIKGAAKIVGLGSFGQLAHVIEDVLVKAQHGQVVIRGRGMDLLLRGVDALLAAARATSDPTAAASRPAEAYCAEVAQKLMTLGNDSIVPSPAPTPLSQRPPARHISIVPRPAEAIAPALEVSSQLTAPTSSENAARILRIDAQSIDRVMALAGESLVEARRIASFGKSLHRMKQRHAALSDTLAALERDTAGGEGDARRQLVADAKQRARECAQLFAEHVGELEGYTRRAEELSDRLYREALKSRMQPFADGTQAFPRLVRDLARQLGKEVRFEMIGGDTDVDRDVLETLKAPLNHLLRNALDHGLEMPDERARVGKPVQGKLRLEARHHAGMLSISVSDDGCGIDVEGIRRRIVQRGLAAKGVATTLTRTELLEFVFLPGFTTASAVTEISGRGIGLDVVKSSVEAVAGSVRIVTEFGKGTTFHLQLPVTRSVSRALVSEVSGEAYAFPLLRIERVVRVPVAELQTLENRQYFVLDGASVALVSARQLFGVGGAAPANDVVSVVVVSDKAQRFGILVDAFMGEHDLVVRPLDARLGKVQDVTAAAILTDGSPALIVDVEDLVRSIDRIIRSGSIEKLGASVTAEEQRAKKRVLVVDDSITVREAERQLLVNRGYEVDVAVDGIDGLNSIRRSRYDLIITDIDMPRLNGIELVKLVKQDAALCDVPIVIVSYKDREEDRMRGLQAGANHYLTKSSFHDETLVQTVEDLIGGAAA